MASTTFDNDYSYDKFQEQDEELQFDPPEPQQSPVEDFSSSDDSSDDEDGEMDIAARLENMSVAQDNSHLQILTHKTLPSELFYQGDSPDLYKSDASAITDEYRGQDLPLMSGEKKDQKMLLRSNAVAMTWIKPSNKDATMHSFGQIWNNGERNYVRMLLHPDSQFPSVEIFVSREGKPDASVSIFANSIMRHAKSSYMGFALTSAHHNRDKLSIDKDAMRPEYETELGKLKQSGFLVQVQLNLLHDPKHAVPAAGPLLAQPIWRNIDQEEVDSLTTKLRLRIDGHSDPPPMTDAEVLIASFQINDKFTFSRRMGGTPDDCKRLFDFMEASMFMCCKYNNLWFYELQVSGRLADASMKDIIFKSPRWMWTRLVGETDASGKIIKATAIDWTEFALPTITPDLETASNLVRLGISRGNDAMADRQQQCFDKQAFAMVGYFNPDPVNPGYYRVDIDCPMQGVTGNKDTLVPELRTRVTLRTRDGSVFKGIFGPQFWDKSKNICLYVDLESSVIDEDFRKPKSVSIEMNRDTSQAERQHGAAIQVRYGPSRVDGDNQYPDIAHYYMSAPQTVFNNNRWVNTMSKAQEDAFVSGGAGQSNEEQHSLKKSFAESTTGISTLIGPPGTGKTYVVSNLLKDYLETNRIHRPYERCPIVVMAPSNAAVDNILQKMKDLTKDSPKPYNFVRFRGAKITPKVATAPLQDGETRIDDLEVALWELVDRQKTMIAANDSLGDLEYHVKFNNMVVKLLASKDDPMHATATKFAIARRQTKAPGISKNERQLAYEQLDEAKAELLSHFWSDVDGAFVTLIGAAHPDLRTYFRPRLATIDEAAMAPLPDALTGLVAFWNSLWHILQSGDPAQQRGRALAEGHNEFARFTRDSIMERIKTGRLHGLDFVQLILQYRMHPEISKLISEGWYKGTLKNHSSTEDMTPDAVTAMRFFSSRFGAAYDGWRVVAVDMSGDDASSRNYNGGSSLFNPKEADAVVEIVKGMMETDAPAQGRKLQPNDFLVTCWYAGMETNLHLVLKRAGLLGNADNKLNVRTVSACQGEEANIQIVAFCVNRPEKPMSTRFVSKKQSMNVALSRAKHMQILVGNFTEWMQARADGHKSLKRNGTNQFLGMLLDSLCTQSSATPYKVIAREDFETGLKGTNIEKSTFKDKIKIKSSRNFSNAFESVKDQWSKQKPAMKRRKIQAPKSFNTLAPEILAQRLKAVEALQKELSEMPKDKYSYAAEYSKIKTSSYIDEVKDGLYNELLDFNTKSNITPNTGVAAGRSLAAVGADIPSHEYRKAPQPEGEKKDDKAKDADAEMDDAPQTERDKPKRGTRGGQKNRKNGRGRA
ncbi:hypothetical protein D6C84_04701 [Aureobasidium pullulans]|uniref:P-loop containing nucleoside triphosphate hydrolase protein n=1 Tax=Aureobasidium pullulans TaxID=5580 RepID=A0A4S9XUJ9_AURPU|nr:hypothetical protein D6C84_04701 [Aureobasidium pullulans]